ncbi:flavodoxin domain-containing protein [Paraglaciecola sp. L1A13]|uniref:flavodoxin domain-containing protein n=1 Tax=Paraglaciecola sp. L1A13 TaxID=2686359 RepID=UPI00131B2995|nr:flavodoxin domain-containing protein [Paraglaciecola sp. L1A13]
MSKVGIFVGSVYGNAQHVAEQVQELLTSKQLVSEIYDDPSVDDFKRCDSYIFVSSSTGQGDIPPNLEFFVSDLKDMFPLMDQKPFAVIGLGDSSYCDSYCGAGEQLQALLLELQGKPVADMLKIDACETLEPEKEALEWIESLVGEFA